MSKPGDENIRGGISDAVIATKQACPECGKKKLTLYADQHVHCFECGHHTRAAPEYQDEPGPRKAPAEVAKAGLIFPEGPGSWKPLTGLRIEQDIAKKFGYFVGPYKGAQRQVAPLYDQTGNLIAQEVRLPGDAFEIVGEADRSKMGLWGIHVFGDNRDRKVVVHANKPSTMATAQVTRMKVPSVSPMLSGDANAVLACKHNFRWLDRFGEIILWLSDTDEGRKATQDIAALFPVGKVKIAKVEGSKDSSDALIQGRPGDIDAALWSAVTWRPVGIVNASEGIDEFFSEGLRTPSWPYPWPAFNERSMGMHPGTVTYHVGGTGIAKSTVMFHMVNHLITDSGKEFLKDYPRQEPTKVAFLGFEDLPHQAKTAMMGIHAGKMLALDPISEKEGRRLYKELFGKGNLEFYDAEQAEYGLEAVKGYVRYVVKGLGCRVVFLDPLTFITSQLPAANRTQAEDQLAGWMAAETKAMGIALHVGYHLRKPDGTPFEEGAAVGLPDIKGSGALTHFSHNVIAYERNQQGDRPDLMRVRWLKNRIARFTGIGCVLQYDMKTGRYEETDEDFPEDNDSDAKRPKFKPSTESY